MYLTFFYIVITSVYISGVNPSVFVDTLSTGILAVGDSVNVVFKQAYDMLAGGDYNFTANTYIKNDGIAENNNTAPLTITVYPIINTFPYNESFESFTNGTFTDFPDGWSTNALFPTPDYYRWQANQGSTPTQGTGPNVDHSLGTKQGKYLYVEAD